MLCYCHTQGPTVFLYAVYAAFWGAFLSALFHALLQTVLGGEKSIWMQVPSKESGRKEQHPRRGTKGCQVRLEVSLPAD